MVMKTEVDDCNKTLNSRKILWKMQKTQPSTENQKNTKTEV